MISFGKKRKNTNLITAENYSEINSMPTKKNNGKVSNVIGPLDTFVVRKSDIIMESQDDSAGDINCSNQIFCRKKCRNPFDSSESESEQSSFHENIGDVVVENANILDYFNTSTYDELTQIVGCSETKSKRIINGRPYSNMEELMASKTINDKIIDGCKEIFLIKKNVSEILQKCERISANLTKRIKPFITDTELSSMMPEDGIFEQPKSLTKGLLLKNYQLVGLNWLRIVHEENVNGILADEMGLGKTIQTIAFISYLYDTGLTGPHIIIVPSSTLNNWRREFRTWCPTLNVAVYHGSLDERRQIRNKISTMIDFNVLLTTYSTSISNKDDRMFIKRQNFHYGVFDEAHMLKNMLTVRYKYLSNFKVKRKLLLTGTPLQNNLLELISLLSFVMPTMFLHSNDALKRMFQLTQRTPQQNGQFNDDKIRQVKDMLNPFCLRRVKSQVLSQMPKKTVEVVLLPMSAEQSRIYKTYINQMRLKRIDRKGQLFPLSEVMDLRKISNHSLLVRNIYTDEILRKMSRDMLLDEDHITSNQQLIFEDFSIMHDFNIHQHCVQYPHAIGKYRLDIDLILSSNKIKYLDEHIPRLIANGDRVLIFSQFLMVLDIITELLNYRALPFLRLDGSTDINSRQDYIDDFNENDDIHIFLLTTRAGGLGINLTAANTVILHDIDYNPFCDRQAEDRCHRIGQLRDVRVIKLISEHSIDECILRIATEKLKLEQVTGDVEMDGDDGGLQGTSGGAGDGCDGGGADADLGTLLRQTLDMSE